jgi:XTP/dITP diphosphohydrolase
VTPEQIDLDLPEIQTNLLTVISFDKCLQAYNQLGRPVVVDDTGIFFEAFNEFPGALSKFLYQGVGMKGMKGMFTEVENKHAHFQTVLTYMDETLSEPMQFI